MDESNSKLWHYIYYDQKPYKQLETSNKQYLETSTTDDSKVDQLNDQLLLHKNNLPIKHHHNQLKLNSNNSNYCKLGFDVESNLKHNNLINKLIYNLFYRYLYKFSYLILIFSLLSLICFLCFIFIYKLPNSFNNSLITSFNFKINSTFDQLSNNEHLVDSFSSFERLLTIETDCSSYTGSVSEGAFEFLGIQYAVPPLHDLRLKPTIPIWKNSTLCKPKQIKKAKKFKSECFRINSFTRKYHGSPDCLYLNVFTPRLDTTAFLDVMVYFHPGFLQFGSGQINGLSPSASLAKKLNIVFVSFNYRLDALGFLALGQFVNNSTNNNSNSTLNLKNKINTTSKSNYKNEISENISLIDQLTCIEWVQRNIKQFGGNPQKIVVFGVDNSGAELLALSTFKSSISKIWSAAPAVYLNKKFSLINCKSIDCFKNKNANELINYFLDGNLPEFRSNDVQNLSLDEWFNFEENNNLQNDYPFDEKLNYDKMQFLIGTSLNTVEFGPGPIDIRKWSHSSYTKYIRSSLDSFDSSISQMALEKYIPNNIKFKLDKITVFRYLVTYKPSKRIKLFGHNNRIAFHLWDLIAFFDQVHLFIEKPTKNDLEFVKQIQNIVMNFIKKENNFDEANQIKSDTNDEILNLNNLVDFKNDDMIAYRKQNKSNESIKWLAYPKSILLLNETISLIDESNNKWKDKCEFLWDKNGLNKYIWIV